MKFKDACNKFYYNQQVIGNQNATVNAYKSHLRPFEVYCNNCDVSKINYKMYCDYIIFLNDKNISSVTKHDYARDLKIVLKFFYKNKIIKNDVASQIEKLPKRKSLIPKIVSVNIIEKILNDVKENNILHVRNALIICLCFDCGLRLSELVRLNVNDFDTDNGVIRVTGKWNKQRNVPLTETVLYYYEKYLNFNSRKKDAIFLSSKNEPITTSCIRTIFKRLKKKYNLQEFHPHLLRHSFATLFLLNGGDALVLQEILGHTTLEMTKNYVHIANSISIAKNKRYSPLANYGGNAKNFSKFARGDTRKVVALTKLVSR